MGLAPSSIRFLAREHKNKPFKSPVLTLGRQVIWVTYDEVKRILISEGIQPQPLKDVTDLTTKIPTQSSGYISDIAFFRLMNVEELYTLDFNDYEHADIIADLNKPIPSEFQGRFNLIFDGGTLEHIFDIKQAMMNISLMLKPKGKIIHLSPTSNYIGHGFYSFSPSLFFDYYLANKFVNLKAYICVQGTDPNRGKWTLYNYEYDSYKGVLNSFRSKYIVATIFVAEKNDDSTHDKIPVENQRGVSEKTVPVSPSPVSSSPLIEMLRRYVPYQVKCILLPVVRIKAAVRKRKYSKSVRLKCLGKL